MMAYFVKSGLTKPILREVWGRIYPSFIRVWLITILLILGAGCQAFTPKSEPFPDFGTLAVSVEPDNIWLFAGETEPHLLTQGGYPQLAPDGCRILFQRPGDTCYQNGFHCSDRDYWLINVDGSSEKWLYSAYDKWSLFASATWSPDATALAVTTTSTAKRVETGDLYWVNVANGTITELVTGTLQGGTGAGGDPHFSPDGHWMATTASRDYGQTQSSIGLVQAGSPNSHLVFFLQSGQNLTWANDSSGFVAALHYFNRWGELELWWVPVEGEPTQLGQISDPFHRLYPVLWQPGGERLAYTQYSKTEESTIHLAARDPARM